jgi:gas vesicle protein
MMPLKKSWTTFFNIVLDPWNLMLLIATAALFVVSVLQDRSGENASAVSLALLKVLLTLSSVILGGRITKQWMDRTESGILVVRGKVAIRNLKLLMHNVAELGTRVRVFISSMKEHPKSLRVITTRNYEEIILKCDSLAEETVNSIENWTDIIPEAGIRTEIGELSKLRGQLNERMIELGQLKKEIKETKTESEEEKANLKSQIRDKENEIWEVRSELLSQQAKFGLPLSSDLSNGSIYDTTYLGFLGKPRSLIGGGALGGLVLQQDPFAQNGAGGNSEEGVETNDDG